MCNSKKNANEIFVAKHEQQISLWSTRRRCAVDIKADITIINSDVLDLVQLA
jgi:hypothetical protein